MNNEYSLEQLKRDALEELRDLLEPDTQYPQDLIHEIADGSVPVYTHDILQYAANCFDLSINEPELGAAFDGSPTPVNIIAANIYEEIYNHLSEHIDELVKELE